MSEAKRYGVRQSERADGCEVTEPGGRVMARTLEPWQADRIARLLNAEAEVRAALRDAFACFGPADAPEVEAFWEGEHDDAVSRERQPDSKEVCARVIAKVRSALSALGESPDAEAVRP